MTYFGLTPQYVWLQLRKADIKKQISLAEYYQKDVPDGWRKELEWLQVQIDNWEERFHASKQCANSYK